MAPHTSKRWRVAGPQGGDGGLATRAALVHSGLFALDGAGNLYVGDQVANRIRRIDATTGIISSIAGNGQDGHTGDGGPATKAAFDGIIDIAVDQLGNVFVSTQRRVRKISASTRTITTVAGGGDKDPQTYGEGYPATEALLYPAGIDIDAAGNLYIADAGNSLVRKVDAITGAITTIAGTTHCCEVVVGVATKDRVNPTDVLVGAGGNIFVTERNQLRRVNVSTNRISTIWRSERGQSRGHIDRPWQHLYRVVLSH